MSKSEKQENTQLLKQLTELLAHGALNDVRTFVQSLYPAETANLLESVQPEDRKKIWKLIPANVKGKILVNLHEEVAAGIIAITSKKDLITAAENLESDDLVDLLHLLPESQMWVVLDSIEKAERSRLESVLAYDDHTAGGLMSLDVITVRPDVSIKDACEYLRKRGKMPANTDNLVVVDRESHIVGILPVSILLTKDPSSMISESMDANFRAIPYQMPAKEVALLFVQRSMLSAPVVSEEGKLLGRITIDDIVHVIREQADHSMMSMAGLDEELDMFAPVVVSAKHRSLWLGVNLFTAFLASGAIDLFENTIDQIVALAVLMPIVASMGGIAGSQTLTLVIRGLALRQIGDANALQLFKKEFLVGVVNGASWAIVVAFIAGIWFQSAGVGLLLGIALIINLMCAAIAGASIPLVLDKLDIDPALAGGVILTTITDVVGFVAFLGLATIFLL